MKSRDTLKSDGPNFVVNHLNTTTGALLDREELLQEYKAREEQRELHVNERRQREVEREERRFEREKEAEEAQKRRAEAQKEREVRQAQREEDEARKQAEKLEKERLKEFNKVWDANIGTRWVNLRESRDSRRLRARLRAAHRVGVNGVQT